MATEKHEIKLAKSIFVVKAIRTMRDDNFQGLHVYIPSKKSGVSFSKLYQSYFECDSPTMVKDLQALASANTIRVVRIKRGYMLFDGKDPAPNGKTYTPTNDKEAAALSAIMSAK